MKRVFGTIITIGALLLVISINFNVKSQSGNNNSLISMNIKAMADTENGQINCEGRCNFINLDICFVEYPYGCLGKRYLIT